MSLSSPKPKNFSHSVANPANLRWKYILDSLIEDKRMTDRKLIDQLKECIDSLGKYPLVLEEVTHCAILIGFNANIINLMKEKVCARANGFEVKEPWNPINDLEYCTLSPISKKSEENGNSQNSLQNVKCKEVPSRDNDGIQPAMVDLTDDDNEEKVCSIKDQEDSDYQMALMLSQREISMTSDNEINRVDQEIADFQMALKLSTEDDNEGLTSQNITQSQGTALIPSNICDNEHKTNQKVLPSICDLPDLDEKEQLEINPFLELAATSVHRKTRSNHELSASYMSNGSNLEFLNQVKDDSLIWRDQSGEHYSFTNSVVVTPPPPVKTSTCLGKKRKKSSSDISSSAAQSVILKNDPLSNRPIHSISPERPFDDITVQVNKNLTSTETSSIKENSSPSSTNITKANKKVCKKRKRTENDTTSSSTQSKKDTPSKAKKYLPKPGSGGYAILIALFYNESSPNYKGYLTKDELIDAAQPFANQSMRFSQPGTKVPYTGYSASSTLVKKELITKTSNPHQIRLTETGRNMAEALIKARETAELQIEKSMSITDLDGGHEMGSIDSISHSSEKERPSLIGDFNDTHENSIATTNVSLSKDISTLSSSDKISKSKKDASFDDPSWLEGLLQGGMESSIVTKKKNETSNLQRDAPMHQQFLYCYISDEGKESNDQNDAEVDIEESVCYLVACLLGELNSSGKTYRIKTRIKEMFLDHLVHAYLTENECEEFSPVSSVEELAVKPTEPLFNEPLENAAQHELPNFHEILPVKANRSKAHQAAAQAAIKRNCTQEAINSIPADSDFFAHLPGMEIDNSYDGDEEETPHCDVRNISTVVLNPGEYDIILVVDAMEVTGGSNGGKKSRKALTVEQLESLKVPFETRKLNIGDFLWIARHKRFYNQLNEEYTSEQIGGKKLTAKKNRELKEAAMARELVLPYIVERKRTDDLRASIMDGRYKEQKQRLSQCGILNKFYLVEEVGGKFLEPSHYAKHSNNSDGHSYHRGIDRDAIEQAVSNTAVRDGFYIKRTKTQGESMKYLATFTNALVQKYTKLRITLKSCPVESVAWNQIDLGVENYHMTKSTEYAPNFIDFNDFSRPDKPSCVREIFCNMLITVKGLSSGMAWAITGKYPTPRMLKKAYDSISNENPKDKEKAIEKILAGIPYDYPAPKKVPPGIAKIIGHLFSDASLN